MGYNTGMQLILWQQFILVLWFCYALTGLYWGYHKSRYQRNSYGLTPQYYLLGAFVWGDAIVFGFFWMGVSAVIFVLQDWLLFQLVITVFWAIRALGESIYWFNQQFSTIHRNLPEKLPGYSIFGNDSIWFVNQIIAQCISVVSTVLSIYFAAQWVGSL